jgi:hypothetical protein
LVFGQGTSPVTLATFTDADPAGTVSDYSASIAWGDGITSTGSVVLGTGNFKVQANHTYVQPGSYTITSTITDSGGVATIIQATATVGIREGQQYQTVLSLALPDPVMSSPPSYYTTTINWGDGNNGNGTATPVCSYATGQLTGSLLVTATHVYASSGTFTISATATNPYTNASSNGTKSVTVGDAILNGIRQSLAAVASNSTGTVAVAQFEDTNSSGTTSQFTATIVWGDGSSNSSGTITAVSGTPGLFNVQGSHTYSSTGAYTIQTTITDSGGQNVVVNTPVTVVNTWTVLSSVSGSGYAPGSRTSDPDRAGLQTLGEATVDLNQGALRVSHALDFDQSPGTDVGGNPMLVYNSGTVNVRPIIQLEIQSDPNGSNPKATQIAVQLTFNGVQQTTQNFTIGTYTAGAVFLVGVEVASPLTATGVYNWSAAVTVTLSNSTHVTASPSGIAQVVVRDQSNRLGAGWGIGGDGLGVARLYTISANGNVPAGMLLATGAGDSRFFTGSGPSYTSPAEDFGTLVKNGDGTFTYTTKTQVKYNFNSSGYLTSVVQPSGLQRGWYVLLLSSSISSPSHRPAPYASMSSNVWWSTPAAPLLARQRL